MIVDLFGVELSVHHNIFVEFLFALQMSMKNTYIKWPSTNMMEKKIANDFQSPHKDSI